MRRYLAVGSCVVLVLSVGCRKEKSFRPEKRKNSPKGRRNESPQKALLRFQDAVERNDADGIWAFISDKSKRSMLTGPQARKLDLIKELPEDLLSKIASRANETIESVKKMDRAALAKMILVAEAVKNRDKIVGARILETELKGDTAILTIWTTSGEKKRHLLIREASGWKLDGEESKKLNK